MTRALLVGAVLAGGVAFGAGLRAEEIPLPSPTGLDMSLGEALRGRRSTRSFDAARKLSSAQVGALLWAAAGVNRPDPDQPRGGKRTAPSAFGAGAVDIVIASSDGLFRYSTAKHALISQDRHDQRKNLTGSAWAREAPLLLLLVVDFDRYPERVPIEERRRYAYADAAVIGQNIYLAARALGLGTVLTASVTSRAGDALGLKEAERVLFVLPVGYEASGDDAGSKRQASTVESDTFRKVVEADWARQEKRWGRSVDDPEAIREALSRAERLLEDLSRSARTPGVRRAASALDDLERRAEDLSTLDADGRTALYHEIRWLTRDAALDNPLLGATPIAFLKRRRFICQMLHEYMGYYYDYGDIAGGGVYVLEKPGRSFATLDLVAGRLPRGNFTTLALSYDARTLYFAFAARAEGKPHFDSPDRRCFHLYAMGADGQDLRQLTDGPDDDFDPCPLPDGSIAFMSTRRGGFIRCNNPWEPLPSHTLHRMDSGGGGVRTLSFHETSEWHPSVLHDGRIVYTRWDYVDRSAANFHGLWVSHPDGTNPVALFGNYTRRINACFQPRAIPGSQRIAFVAGAHHANVGGALVVLDPDKVALDSETGEDRLDSLDVITPEVCFPEAPGWPGSYFHGPWPLSEDYFLVGFSFDPLPGMGSRVNKDTETGLYLLDRFGNLELLYREAGISSMYPIPLAPRPIPPALLSERDPQLGGEAELLLTDVRISHLEMPAFRPIRELRVFQVLPKAETHIVNQPRLGYANAESARMLLGTVPVESDGSAYFRVPSGKPLYFQAVDEEGRAVQGMRSVTYMQPGERRSCVGCHEPPGTSPVVRPTLASRRAPSKIRPGPDGSRPWSYPRLVQPILDARCVRCHDGTGGPETLSPDLTGRPAGEFTASYESLKPYVRWYEWGRGIGGDVTRPGRMPADESPLTRILDDEHHAREVRLEDSERRGLYLWLDGNAAFYGTYAERARTAQRRGEQVPAPELQ